MSESRQKEIEFPDFDYIVVRGFLFLSIFIFNLCRIPEISLLRKSGFL